MLRVGDTVTLSYVDQNRSGIDPEEERLGRSFPKVWTYIAGRQGGGAQSGLCVGVRSKGPDQQKPAGVFSR